MVNQSLRPENLGVWDAVIGGPRDRATTLGAVRVAQEALRRDGTSLKLTQALMSLLRLKFFVYSIYTYIQYNCGQARN